MIRHLAPLLLCLSALVANAQQPPPRTDPAQVPLLYSVPGMDRVTVNSDVVYNKKSGGPELKADIYSPANIPRSAKLPVIIFISGASQTKHWSLYRSYGKIAAAQGFIGVNFDKRYDRGPDGLKSGYDDTLTLLTFLRDNAFLFHIDSDRMVLWGFSGGGRLLASGMRAEGPRPAAIVNFYGVAELGGDLDNFPEADRPAMLARFSQSRLIDSSPQSIAPIFIARAGLDNPGLNSSIDSVLQAAIRNNVRVQFINYPDGHHAFDIFDDKPRTRDIIRAAFTFIAEATK